MLWRIPPRCRSTGPRRRPLCPGARTRGPLSPGGGSPPRVAVGEGFPRVAGGGVVLPDRPPLPLGEVRPEALPVLLPACVLGQPDALRRSLVRVPPPPLPP